MTCTRIKVIIENCFISAGDDGIAIKSGLNAAGRCVRVLHSHESAYFHVLGLSLVIVLNAVGRAFNMPSQHIVVRNVTVAPPLDNLSTNGVSIGSEMSGGVHNVTVTNCTIR